MVKMWKILTIAFIPAQPDEFTISHWYTTYINTGGCVQMKTFTINHTQQPVILCHVYWDFTKIVQVTLYDIIQWGNSGVGRH